MEKKDRALLSVSGGSVTPSSLTFSLCSLSPPLATVVDGGFSRLPSSLSTRTFRFTTRSEHNSPPATTLCPPVATAYTTRDGSDGLTTTHSSIYVFLFQFLFHYSLSFTPFKLSFTSNC
ncbi:hypothetical protein PIB30_054377 [Stylosanthes scabra]|uniref:Uncharacterized protein n=1 Tax=Stylosanthes scabra TaxID=79078 RepID=A0ABU6SIQ2_9FABA|nr:hypothetical protein [Stylosanthes scabra]